MSEEQLKAFLEKVKADTSLQEKLNAAASPDGAVEIAKEAGFSITAEDIQSMQSSTIELSDAELEVCSWWEEVTQNAAGGCHSVLVGEGPCVSKGLTVRPTLAEDCL